MLGPHLLSERVHVRDIGDSSRSHADRIHLHLKGFSCLGCRHGRDFSGVILSVGHEDDDFALGFKVLEPVQSGRKPGSDGRAVLNAAQFQPVEVAQQKSVIQRQWGCDVGATGKGNEADSVSAAFGDEFAQGILGDDEAVDWDTIQLKVLGVHASRQINADHDVDAALLRD